MTSKRPPLIPPKKTAAYANHGDSRDAILAYVEANIERIPIWGCWLWLASTSRGYPKIHFRGKRWQGHRLIYSLLKEPIPDGKCLCHHCDVRECVNPEHMFVGSQHDNMRDLTRKGYMKRAVGERSPLAKLTEEDVLFIRANPSVPYAYLRERYGIGNSHIQRIKRGETWRHI
jgi:hypothetical protein